MDDNKLPDLGGLEEKPEPKDYHLVARITDRQRKVNPDKKRSKKKRELAAAISRNKYLYYNEQPEISDEKYDELKRELEELNTQDEYVSWTEEIGADGFENENQAKLAAILQLSTKWPPKTHKIHIESCELKKIQKRHLILPEGI